jgi:hypothetical protein
MVVWRFMCGSLIVYGGEGLGGWGGSNRIMCYELRLFNHRNHTVLDH